LKTKIFRDRIRRDLLVSPQSVDIQLDFDRLVYPKHIFF
jgi:hypothetical protein